MDFRTIDRTWLVAEIGVNHEGDVVTAERLVKLASEAGADAVKFQTYDSYHYVSTEQPERLERVKRFELSQDDFRRLAECARHNGVTFFSTPLDEGSVEFLDPLVPVFKVSSGDITYLDLISRIASKKKPIIVSTGLATETEVGNAIDAIERVWPGARDSGSIMLMHCVAAYPTPPDQANLYNINWLKDTFGLPVGYSDHTLGTKACELAVCLGARVVEKHFTYRSSGQEFHDHALSAEPSEFRDLVSAIRNAEMFLGKAKRERTVTELKFFDHLRRSIAAAVDIGAGEKIGHHHLTFLRPAWGIAPDRVDSVVGRSTKRLISSGELIRLEDLN